MFFIWYLITEVPLPEYKLYWQYLENTVPWAIFSGVFYFGDILKNPYERRGLNVS